MPGPKGEPASLNGKKTRLRSRIKNDLLNSLLHISINGPIQESPELPKLIREVAKEWLRQKHCRKLKKLPPTCISTAASTSANTTQLITHLTEPEVERENLPEEKEQEELITPTLPTPKELDPCPSSCTPQNAEEPNFEEYVIALISCKTVLMTITVLMKQTIFLSI